MYELDNVYMALAVLKAEKKKNWGKNDLLMSKSSS